MKTLFRKKSYGTESIIKNTIPKKTGLDTENNLPNSPDTTEKSKTIKSASVKKVNLIR